jgi:hypothetical protein
LVSVVAITWVVPQRPPSPTAVELPASSVVLPAPPVIPETIVLVVAEAPPDPLPDPEESPPEVTDEAPEDGDPFPDAEPNPVLAELSDESFDEEQPPRSTRIDEKTRPTVRDPRISASFAGWHRCAARGPRCTTKGALGRMMSDMCRALKG